MKTRTSSSSSQKQQQGTAPIATVEDDEDESSFVTENTPEIRSDVAREGDTDESVELPAAGTASSARARFLEESSKAAATGRSKREITPPIHGSGGEYVSEPRGFVEKYEAKPDAGVFESQPQQNPDVVTSYQAVEEAQPEQGFTRNVAAKFRQMESQKNAYTPSPKKFSPEREVEGGEFVSEPKPSTVEKYEAKVDSGEFESKPAVNPDVVQSGEAAEEILPERGTTKNLAARFRQISQDNKSPPSAGTPRAQREITPDKTGKVEYESQPQRDPETISSDTQVVEEYLPERGFTKNVAARFKELESNAKSPPMSPGRRKEFTPPRESGVIESTPEVRAEVVHSDDLVQEALPEKGTARNIAQRFRQLESENKSGNTSPRPKKQFTPPPQQSGGVYENQPKQFQAEYNRPAESGIIENTPVAREDVVRGTEPPKYEEELPERGAAKNMVNKWKQMEAESSKKAKSPGSRPKEFTPPREEPILTQRKSPRTPMSPGGAMDNGSVHPSELPGQYQPQEGESVFESSPESRSDVIREGDNQDDGLPKRNTAKKMLARFQSLQAEANKPSPAEERQAKNVRYQ